MAADEGHGEGPVGHPMAGPLLCRFLTGMVGGWVARLDGDGTIREASRHLRPFLPGEAGANLRDILTPGASRRWDALLGAIGPDRPARAAWLRLRGGDRPRRFACLVHREQGGSLWLLAIPRDEAGRSGSIRGLVDELAALSRHLKRSDRLVRLAAHARLEARTDALTGLANRRQGRHWLRRAVARAEAGGAPCCCVVADLDDFKSINDTLGHAAGDRALRIASRVFQAHLRPADRVARDGGDEFLLVLPETDLGGGRVVAERLRSALRARSMRPLGRPLSVSLGVACRRPGESASSLLRRADQALLCAKRAGRDGVVVDP